MQLEYCPWYYFAMMACGYGSQRVEREIPDEKRGRELSRKEEELRKREMKRGRWKIEGRRKRGGK